MSHLSRSTHRTMVKAGLLLVGSWKGSHWDGRLPRVKPYQRPLSPRAQLRAVERAAKLAQARALHSKAWNSGPLKSLNEAVLDVGRAAIRGAHGTVAFGRALRRANQMLRERPR